MHLAWHITLAYLKSHQQCVDSFVILLKALIPILATTILRWCKCINGFHEMYEWLFPKHRNAATYNKDLLWANKDTCPSGVARAATSELAPWLWPNAYVFDVIQYMSRFIHCACREASLAVLCVSCCLDTKCICFGFSGYGEIIMCWYWWETQSTFSRWFSW